MTHPSHETNGASLEDCHTNYYALTDLCGIKWRKFVCGEWNYSGETLQDPVLSSFCRCLNNDILCVWRRVGSPAPLSSTPGGVGVGGPLVFDPLAIPSTPPPTIPALSLTAAKELWIFWYGEEPDLSALVNQELLSSSSGDQGAWERGLTYECRTLLFKALHNLIERCLLSKDFIRLGKWFVQPYDGSKKIIESSGSRLSISFSFFVHGESTVCISIDVRQHSPVRTLVKEHLEQTQASAQSSHPIHVILAPFGLAGTLSGQSFKRTDPNSGRLLEEWRNFYPLGNKECPSNVDPVVEVILSGVKLKYPSSYVFVTDLDDSTSNFYNAATNEAPATKNPNQPLSGVPVSVVPLHQHHPDSMAHPSSPATILPERAWQDGIVSMPDTPPMSPRVGPEGCNDTPPGHWNFNHPARKSSCSCFRHIKQQGTGGNSNNNAASYHQYSNSSMANCNPNNNNNNGCNMQSSSGVNSVENCNNNNNSSSNNNNNNMLPINTPPSITPSPLPNHNSQPSSIPAPSSSDGAMPGLSPQHSGGPMSAQQIDSRMYNMNKNCGDFQQGPKSVLSNSLFSPYAGVRGTSECGGDATFSFKRPQLFSKEYESALHKDNEEINPSHLLYDFSTMNAWLNHPVKKFKATEQKVELERRKFPYTSNLLYLPLQCRETREECDNMDVSYNNQQVDVKCKFNNTFNYDDGLGISPSDIKQEDRDQLFETSDDASGEETSMSLQVQTPPSSCGGGEDPYGNNGSSTTTLLVRQPRNSGGTMTILRPEDLGKMFPTPPSLEHHAAPSPGGGHLSDNAMDGIECSASIPLTSVRYRQEIPCENEIPRDERIQEPVFVPPLCAKLIGSTEYSPLVNLPSQSLPPISWSTTVAYKPSYFYPQQKKQQQHSEKIQVPTGPMSNMSQSNTPIQGPPSVGPGVHMNSRPGSAAPQPPGGGGGGGGGMMMPINHMQHMGQPIHHHHPSMNPHIRMPPMSPNQQFSPNPMMGWQGVYRGRPPCQPPPPYSPAAASYLKAPPPAIQDMLRHPEANALVINVLLSDTFLNIFRDHNFDSCTLCVCNDGPKNAVNIKGADAGVYLPQANTPGLVPLSPYASSFGSPHHFGGNNVEEEPIRCSCGFSAVVNRRLSHRAGLFFEDEVEITGFLEEPHERDDLNGVTAGVVDLLREQCVAVHSSCNALFRAARQYKHANSPPALNLLELRDTNQVAVVALEQGRLAHIEAMTMCKEDMSTRQHLMQHCASSMINSRLTCVHRWPFMRSKGPRCNQDIIRVMKLLQPILQDSVQKKRLWEAPYTVTGPLTWRQFHRLAGRGTEDRCEPQPVPSIVVGHDKDWLSISPYALQYWEKLLLEPYSYGRDVAYIVVAPDNEYVLKRTRTFFKELSCSYEICRLGRHCPITKVLRDGILRVGKSAASKLAKEAVDEWFNMLENNATTTLLRLYALVCKHYLAPQLSTLTIDSTLLDSPEASANRSNAGDITKTTPSPMPPPPSTSPSVPDKTPSTPKSDSQDDCSRSDGGTSSSGTSFLNDSTSHEEEERDPPAIVIYLVEPFSIGSDDTELHRLACLALLRCYNNVIASLPENIRSNITVQIISLESILELGRSGDRNKNSDEMRALALSVFSQCRRLLTHTANVKALTGFGTAAMTDLFLKTKDEKNRAAYRAYCPPYILARNREKLWRATEDNSHSGQSVSIMPTDHQCSILYVTYCLSEDQRWILVTATDEQGIIFESSTINIHVPNRNRRRRAPARRIGLQKVMDFILGVMSQSVTSWRLIVGRVGRLGHGELKSWSSLLSRKSLQRASQHLKECCKQCGLLNVTDVPCVLSACLVSLEADSTLRVMPDQFTPDQRFSQAAVNCNLSTPQDVTTTHILVFPTSATTQSSQTTFQEQQSNDGPDLDGDLIFPLPDDLPEGYPDVMGDFDFFNDPNEVWSEIVAPGVSSPAHGASQPGSPFSFQGDNDQRSPFASCNRPQRNGMNGEMQEEVGTLLQQPLALGYFVSTAPTGRMPRWFWSACPHLENVCPTFLKSALHMHTMPRDGGDEFLQQPQQQASHHPLDSQYTTDVLRYVLEGYNALSWLAIDSNTRDRLSCLPVHMQVLMQLYHMMSALT